MRTARGTGNSENPSSASCGRFRERLRAWLILAAVVLIGWQFPGCKKETQVAAIKQSQQHQLRQANQSASLLEAAARQLNDLPGAVDTELHPPSPVLDSRNSSNKQDVYAICIANPAIPNSLVNVLHVPGQNSRFKSIGVRPGDIIKYFVRQDRTVDEESRQSGLARQLAMDLKVAQVLDESTLIIEGGLSQEIGYPAKIEIWRSSDSRQKEINEKLVLYVERRLPPLGWEPVPEEQVLSQVLTWLNQWIRQTNPPATWKREPLLDSLGELGNEQVLKPFISAEALASPSFQPTKIHSIDELADIRTLQETEWLRNIRAGRTATASTMSPARQLCSTGRFATSNWSRRQMLRPIVRGRRCFMVVARQQSERGSSRCYVASRDLTS